jgi:hypothetical protein
VKEKPILFSGPLVRAVLRDVDPKTQTRRLVKPQADVIVGDILGQPQWYLDADPSRVIRCPYGATGDRLWVREAHAPMCRSRDTRVAYRADMIVQNRMPRRPPPGWTTEDLCPWPVDNTKGRGYAVTRWTPSIHMPRALSRIDLEVTRVRVQRLQDITEEDARAEGLCQRLTREGTFYHHEESTPSGRWWIDPVDAFRHLWDAINGERATWDSNPWVWALDFKRVRP